MKFPVNAALQNTNTLDDFKFWVWLWGHHISCCCRLNVFKAHPVLCLLCQSPFYGRAQIWRLPTYTVRNHGTSWCAFWEPKQSVVINMVSALEELCLDVSPTTLHASTTYMKPVESGHHCCAALARCVAAFSYHPEIAKAGGGGG